MAPSKPFTAIIIGGSVAGLTLAHTFARANIDYVLLEARDSLAPQLGAGIVIMPNGCRILDQMDLLETMKEFMTPMALYYRRKRSGEEMGVADWPLRVSKRLGYPCGISERQMFLGSMYEQLKDKSKILLRKKVVKFEHGDESVTVHCEDGSSFQGDLVIGADGVHSKTRAEMQRIGNEKEPGIMDRDLNRISAGYNAIYGISPAHETLNPGDSHVASDIDHSSLAFVSNHGITQWFFFSKLDRNYKGSSIPRFTREEMEAQVEKHKDFHFTEKVTLGDLMKTTTSLGHVALEEANHEHWSYGRIVCVGDAIHKMTPNMGQGGNQAIESSATLTNLLHALLAKHPKPKTADLKPVLQEYQDQRLARTHLMIRLSGLMTRDQSLANLNYTLRFLYFPQPSSELFTEINTELFTSGPYLEFLPKPQVTIGNQYWEKDEQGTDGVRARL